VGRETRDSAGTEEEEQPVSIAYQENIHLHFYLSTFRKKKKRVFLCFTPPENEFGNQLFLDSSFLVDFSTFSLVQARTSPKK